MTDDYRPIEPKRVDDRQHIISQLVGIVAVPRRAGAAKSATRHAVDVIERCQFRSEFIERVSRCPEASEEDNGLAMVAPLKHLQLNVRLDRNESRLMRRFVLRPYTAREPQA